MSEISALTDYDYESSNVASAPALKSAQSEQQSAKANVHEKEMAVEISAAENTPPPKRSGPLRNVVLNYGGSTAISKEKANYSVMALLNFCKSKGTLLEKVDSDEQDDMAPLLKAESQEKRNESLKHGRRREHGGGGRPVVVQRADARSSDSPRHLSLPISGMRTLSDEESGDNPLAGLYCVARTAM